MEQIQARRTFDRRTDELNGSLSGSACFTLLLTNYGKRIVDERFSQTPELPMSDSQGDLCPYGVSRSLHARMGLGLVEICRIKSGDHPVLPMG